MKKKHPEHVNLERWLISYADFITLLFALFVVLFAISQADIAKFRKFTQGIKSAFSAGPVGMIDLEGTAGGNTANPFDTVETPGSRVLDMPAGKTNTSAESDPSLQDVKELLEETISLELGTTDLSDKLQLYFDSRGLVVRIAVKDFFDEGQSDVRMDLRPILDRIGKVLSRTKRLIRLEGHVDAGEVKGGKESLGWELSAKRAAWLAQYWMSRFEFEPSRMGIGAYSRYRPLTEDEEPWNRAKNRRVEIIILNNRYTSP